MEYGYFVAAVSKRLGVSTHSLYSWNKRCAVSAPVVMKEGQSAEIWRLKQEMEMKTIKWVDWFNHRRLLVLIGNISPV